jgi:hypothetical protein
MYSKSSYKYDVWKKKLFKNINTKNTISWLFTWDWAK